VLVVDAVWSETGGADQRPDWARVLGPRSGLDGQPVEPMYVVVDRDAQPAVALRVRWTLRLFEVDEALPHAALYAVRRHGGQLLPLLAACRGSSLEADEARDRVLARLSANPGDARRRAGELRRALVASARRGWRVRRPPTRHLARAVAAVKAAFDRAGPEFTAAPGPLRPAVLALLLVAARQGDDGAAVLAHQTLEAMARGGVRDQLDGGFFRAARDPGWRLPDFVRTAALNAALLGVYTIAAAQLGERTFAEVARGIGNYLLTTLRDPNTGGFFASQAVDESYYTWTSHEVTAALPVEMVQAACMYFNVQPAARVVTDPRKNVLYVAADADAIARFVGQPVATVTAQLADVRAPLLAARAEREPPRLDRTRYVDVNAQVCSALLAGASALGEPGWQTTALQTLNWLEEVCFSGDTPVVPHRTYLGDHAALARTFLDAHACTGEPRDLARAEAVATTLLAQFRDRASGALLDAPRPSLVSRAFWPEQSLEDLAGPSPVAVAVGMLLDLSRRTGRTHYQQAAEAALGSAARAAAEDPLAATGYALALWDAGAVSGG
jgi:uncharacterized protein YyaL (SSP411 family)